MKQLKTLGYWDVGIVDTDLEFTLKFLPTSGMVWIDCYKHFIV